MGEKKADSREAGAGPVGGSEEGAADRSGGSEAEPARSDRPASRILDGSLPSAALPERARCPFCGGRDTEQFSAFGSAVSTSQYYCNRCRTVFEFMKPRGGR